MSGISVISQRFSFYPFEGERTFNKKKLLFRVAVIKERQTQLTQPCDLEDFLLQISAAQRPSVGCVLI